MTASLRPMNLGEILDRTFQIYRSRFWVFVGIAAFPAAAMFVIQVVESDWLHLHSAAHHSSGSLVLWNYVYWLGLSQISGFLALLVSPSLVRVTSTALLGVNSSIWSAIRFAAARWRSYLWIVILKLIAESAIPQTLVVVLVGGEFVIAALAGGWKSPRVFGGFAAVLMFAIPVAAGATLLLWTVPRLSLAIPAAVIEKTVGFKALRRSWTLTNGSRARILVTWAMMSLFSWLLMFGAGLMVRWIFMPIWQAHPFGFSIQRFYAPAIYAAWNVTLALIIPIAPIAITLFYYDQRIRHEGYDIERMMDAAGMISPATPSAASGPAVSIAAEEGHP